MQTKQLIFSLIAITAILFVSCSERQSATGTEVSGTQIFTFSLATEGDVQTRAAAPTVTGYKLQYFLQVLNADGNAIEASSDNNETGTFSVELPAGVAYTCLFWAHYIPDTGGENEFFDTTDLKAVTLKKHLTHADQCQAFCATASITVGQASGVHSIVLRRAVAQVNIKSNEKMEKYSKLTVSYTNVPNTFNVSDNTVSSAGSVTDPSAFEVTDFTANAGADGRFTYQSVYSFASADGAGSMLSLEIDTYNSANPGTPLQSVTIDHVPTKKNYKTNVVISFNPATLTHTYTCDFADWDADIDVSVWDGQTPAADANAKFGDASKNGDSAETAYVISGASDLAQLAANVNSGISYENKYFKQTVNIHLNNHDWMPIGTTTNPLRANYDGGGYEIIDLKANVTQQNGNSGLFGYADGNIVIKNIHVSGDVKSKYKAGGICGGMSKYEATTTGVISGCSFKGSVEASYAGGGICGEAEGKTIIVSCANYGTVICAYQGGGIVGIASTATGAVVAGCYNAGNINEGYSSATSGGIVGASGTAIGCYNTGVVDGARIKSLADNTTNCFTAVLYGESQNGTTVFGGSAWPAYNTAGSFWFVADAPDGSYTYDTNSKTFSDCKFWKTGGRWNDTAPVYPKLWWEQ